LDWSQRLGFRETAYTHSRQAKLVLPNALNRLSVEYSSRITGPQLQRDFGSWRHVIEPSVDTRYIGGPDRFNQTIVVDDVDLETRTNESSTASRTGSLHRVKCFRGESHRSISSIPRSAEPSFQAVGMCLIRFWRSLDSHSRTARVAYRRSFPRCGCPPAHPTSTDIEVDYDTRDHLFRSAGIAGNANRGQFGAGISYFFTRRSVIEIPNNQLRGSFTYGNQLKPGLSTAFAFAYDVQHSLFQGSTAQLGYNMNCYGLSFEVSQFNIGARVETRFRFAFTLKDLGSVGTLGARERLF
jgi:hypothetical protein